MGRSGCGESQGAGSVNEWVNEVGEGIELGVSGRDLRQGLTRRQGSDDIHTDGTREIKSAQNQVIPYRLVK